MFGMLRDDPLARDGALVLVRGSLGIADGVPRQRPSCRTATCHIRSRSLGGCQVLFIAVRLIVSDPEVESAISTKEDLAISCCGALRSWEGAAPTTAAALRPCGRKAGRMASGGRYLKAAAAAKCDLPWLDESPNFHHGARVMM